VDLAPPGRGLYTFLARSSFARRILLPVEVTTLTLLLNPIEVRILGALLEKEVTTPEYYPLSLHALTRACNQKSNRHPVVDFDEKTVQQTLDGLTFDKDLAKRVISDDSRVPKYRQNLTEKLHLTRPQAAALCILMLRGPQTPGEIRGRTERLHDFAAIEDVETTLQGLIEHATGALVSRLPRQPGHKEVRYAHLLCGEVLQEEEDVLEPAGRDVQADNDRLEALEQEVAALTEELAALKQAFLTFKKQFE
jgi:uncharacterized protein YceH (UPF0502 family)